MSDQYTYKISEKVRLRILYAVKAACDRDPYLLSMGKILFDVKDLLLQKHGHLRRMPSGRSPTGHETSDHFVLCTDEEAAGMIPLFFDTHCNAGGAPTVDAINAIFEEENIGYELTPIRQIEDPDATLFGRRSPGMKAYRLELPEIIRKDEMRLHKDVVKPCLHILSDSRFSVANDELLDAFEKLGQRKYADAITSAGSAFETVMKTILTLKGWHYDTGRDTCSDLVTHLKSNGLVFPFYATLLTASGTVRNKLGDAHGKGPAPEFTAEKEHAEHMLYFCCLNIVFLITLAKL